MPEDDLEEKARWLYNHFRGDPLLYGYLPYSWETIKLRHYGQVTVDQWKYLVRNVQLKNGGT